MMANRGPHIQAALICERVLQEQDGVSTAVRIIDRVFFGVPEGGTPTPQPVTMMVGLKSGDARGSFKVEIRLEKPSGEQSPFLPPAAVLLEGEERGVNLVANILFEPEMEGLYWFDVLFENERITRVPLRAVFQPIPVRSVA